MRAKLARRRRRYQAAETALTKAAQIPAATPDERAEAWCELAQTFDQQGSYDQAMQAAVNAKQQLLPRDRAERETSDFVLSRFRQLYDNLTAAQLRSWVARSEPLSGHPPLALLAGFPRSGTTLIEQALDAHPGLISSEERDIMGFEVFPALTRAVPDRSGVADLLDRVDDATLATEQARYFEYNEDWLGEPLLPLPVFLRLFPRFHTPIALRDPRDVIISCFLLYLPLNPLSVHFLTLERAALRSI